MSGVSRIVSELRRLGGARATIGPGVRSVGPIRQVRKHCRRSVDVGGSGMFYSPAGLIANAINEALDPHAAPPRRFVPKAKWRSRFVDSAGCVLTQRFRGWRLEAVAAAGSHGVRYLMWLLETDDGTLIPARQRTKIMLLVAAYRRSAEVRS